MLNAEGGGAELAQFARAASPHISSRFKHRSAAWRAGLTATSETAQRSRLTIRNVATNQSQNHFLTKK